MDPAVSVCVPTWNGERYLAETLRNALAQTFTDFELLVVDDGSHDHTLEIAGSFRDPRIRVHADAERRGLPGNWNRCLERARGRDVLLLCQDDLLVPEALATLHSALCAAPDATLACARREIRYEGVSGFPLQGRQYADALESFQQAWHPGTRGIDLVASALREGRDPAVNVIGEPSFVLFRREAAVAVGGFDTAYRQLPDWDLWLRLAHRGTVAFTDRSIGVYRVHGEGASSEGLAHVPDDNVRLIAGIRRLYGPMLDAKSRRKLRHMEWRHRWRRLVHTLHSITG
jgi:glycosyltransferase involved in cell wall biosynthesis